MLQPERVMQIREMIQENKMVTISELSKIFKVSPSTIRRDLKILEKERVVDRFYGGVATYTSRTLFAEREQINKEEKKLIGIEGAKLVKNGATIILDAGTTVIQVAKNLNHKKNITVITTTINIARLLEGKPGFKVLLTGGLLSLETDSLIGVLAKQTFDHINADIAFLGCEGISIDSGVMYPDLDIAEIKRAIVNSAKETVLVADHSKFNRISLTSAFPITAVNKIITDNKLSQEYIKALESKGIEVIIAG